MTTEYRKLGAYERVVPGDQFKSCTGLWVPTDIGERGYTAGFVGFEYRRPLPKLPSCVPQWRHPDAPGCPVHVLWAESPPTVRTVAQVAAEAKPEALKPIIDPGTGYRLLEDDEIVEFGDQFLGHLDKWFKCESTIDRKAGYCGWVIRRKKPVPEPQYRPYTNAAEAAAGLQGKLITHERSTAYYPVTRVNGDVVEVAGDDITFVGLRRYWKFTDGTPCGVLITNQGKQ